MRWFVAALASSLFLLASVASVAAAPPRETHAVSFPLELRPESRTYTVAGIDVLGTGGNEPETAPRYFLAHDTWLHAFDLVLESSRALEPGQEAVLRVDCDPSGPGCGVLAEAAGALPLPLSASRVATPPGAILRFYAFLRGGDGLPGIDADASADSVVRGVLRTVRDPNADAVPQATVAIDFDGHTGPCLPGDEIPAECSYPYGEELDLGMLPGALTAMRLQLTWTAQTPLSETLRVDVQCRRGPMDTPCDGWPAAAAAEGPSPLVLDLQGLQTTQDSEYRVIVWDRSIDEVPAGTAGFPLATHQEYHLGGEYSYALPA